MNSTYLFAIICNLVGINETDNKNDSSDGYLLTFMKRI